MNTERKETTYRIGGILGLAALLGLVLWARQPRRLETPAHDHADPAQHEHAVEGKPLEADATGQLQPSGRVEDGIRVVDYDAVQYGFAPDPLVVRAGEPIRLAVKSRDVAHGVMIPEVEFSTDMPTDRRKIARLAGIVLLTGLDAGRAMLLLPNLFFAFVMLVEPKTLPGKRGEQWILGGACGLLATLSYRFVPAFEGDLPALLTVNLLRPWMISLVPFHERTSLNE